MECIKTIHSRRMFHLILILILILKRFVHTVSGVLLI